jgi:DNA polymerase kappa
MEKSRPLHKYWGHFDFDMFYVACELLSKPEWKDLPCAVGG